MGAMSAQHGPSRRILVVEDSQLMNAYYRKLLCNLPGHEVSFALDGREALRRIATEGEPDVLILDINMPVMDGFDFLAEYRQTASDSRARIVIVSTEGSADDRIRGLRAGADAYLSKPFQPEALLALLAASGSSGAPG
jgi:two-component system, chemotaxis family, chemotaxis protein CheY